MRILILGSGGREHAIGVSIAQSPACKALFFAPGNAGTASIGHNLSLNPLDANAVLDAVNAHQIDLVVIGPEAPLEVGVADHLRAANVSTVGPGKAGAIMESSKDWSKQFMLRHGIPTAAYRSFVSGEEKAAEAYIRQHPLPVVVKASGLAAGKGVLICLNHDEAVQGTLEMLSGTAFGEAGQTVVIEEFLSGIELSVFVLTDGQSWKILPEAKDYKRIGEGDEGPNTGGMGAVSPVPFADPAFMQKINAKIIEPTIQGLSMEGIPYIGFIFFGLIKVDGEPYVIEYNARMGDPETEVVFPRIASDTAELLFAAATGKLSSTSLSIRPETAATIFLVSGGYPGSYPKGKAIHGLEKVEGSYVFHAGTKVNQDGIVTDGGRVLAVTSFGNSLQEALALSIENAEKIDYEGKYYRRDIGWEFL